jgi:hypothetical protein
LLDFVEEDVAPLDVLAFAAAPFTPLLEAEPLAAEAFELLELLEAEALAAALVFSRAAISASTTAISEDTICASVALAAVFEAASVAICFSREASCFCRAAICAVLLLELPDPTAETMALSFTFGRLDARPLIM